jgi:hypothetical protein
MVFLFWGIPCNVNVAVYIGCFKQIMPKRRVSCVFNDVTPYILAVFTDNAKILSELCVLGCDTIYIGCFHR